MPDWTHPRIANPACRANVPTEDIAREARSAFNRRKDTYPLLVSGGSITADEARDDLEAWRAIAKDWHWIAFGEGEPASRETLDSRTEALDIAINRWFAQLDGHGQPPTETENEQLALLCAMRWWAGRERAPTPRDHIRWTAALMHDWRARNGHPTRGQLLAAQAQPENKEAA